MSADVSESDEGAMTCSLDFEREVAVVTIPPEVHIEVPFDWFDSVLVGLQALRRLVFEEAPDA